MQEEVLKLLTALLNRDRKEKTTKTVSLCGFITDLTIDQQNAWNEYLLDHPLYSEYNSAGDLAEYLLENGGDDPTEYLKQCQHVRELQSRLYWVAKDWVSINKI